MPGRRRFMEERAIAPAKRSSACGAQRVSISAPTAAGLARRPDTQVSAVSRAGGEPWLLPHLPVERAESVLGVLDGLVISGGDCDVPPAYYQQPIRHSYGMREQRSAFERALIIAARHRQLPLLGICGGLQILNVALGGDLYQDLSEKPGCLDHQQAAPKQRPHHSVDIAPGSLLSRLVCANRLMVNSTHHQLVRRLGQDLRASAVAPDGVIEAVEAADGSFILGVQWHPEALVDDAAQQAIYGGLVAAAKKP